MIHEDRFSYPKSFYAHCEKLLNSAFKEVPLYQEWKKFDPGESKTLEERFDALPILDKEAMRNHFPLGLMPQKKNLEEGLKKEEIEYTFTSGTTSDKVINIWNQDWWNRSEISSWKLNKAFNGIPYPAKTAKLASSLNVGINCEEDLPFSHRLLGDTLYLNEKTSLIQWQRKHLQRMVDELNRFKPDILEANPSLLARVAFYAIDNRLQVFSPKAIVFTFEFPSAVSLRAIRKVFSSPFVSSYGSTETGFVLEECEDGLLHQNVDFCRIDFIPLAEHFHQKDLGTIVVSTFDNPWNYIIRFAVGDLVRLHKDGKCSCGRNEGMLIDAIEGRNGNVTFSVKGDLVTTKMADDALASCSVLRDYHLEQKDQSHYVLEAMLEPGSDKEKAVSGIKGILTQLYGEEGDYNIVIKDNLLPGPAGKFRRTQADFAFDEKELFK